MVHRPPWFDLARKWGNLLTPQAKQLGGLPTRYFSLAIEFEHDQLAGRLFQRAMQLFEQIKEILLEFDLDDSHGCVG